MDWLKFMVTCHQSEVLDPNLKDKPSPQELERITHIALQCVDLEAEKRPKMSQVVHMLESYDSAL